MTPAVLAGLPPALLGLLAAWSLWDVLQVDNARGLQATAVLWVLSVVCLAFGVRYGAPALRRAGLALLGFLYFGVHVLFLPLALVPALTFLVILFVQVELRVLAERFAPIVARNLSVETRAVVRGGLARAVARLSMATAMAFLIPIFAADLAVAGTVPVTTIPTALLLAGGLVAVIVILALLPVWQRRREPSVSPLQEETRGKL